MLAILNLYEAFLVKIHKLDFSFKKSQKQVDKSKDANKEIKNSKKLKINKDQQNEEAKIALLNKLNIEISGKIKTYKKYGGLDENNKFLISLSSAKQINKDFNLLSINFSTYAYINQKEINRESKTKNKASLSFKPSIDPNSEKLSINFRKKIQNVKKKLKIGI